MLRKIKEWYWTKFTRKPLCPHHCGTDVPIEVCDSLTCYAEAKHYEYLMGDE